jgi:hypothetical protein
MGLPQKTCGAPHTTVEASPHQEKGEKEHKKKTAERSVVKTKENKKRTGIWEQL